MMREMGDPISVENVTQPASRPEETGKNLAELTSTLKPTSQPITSRPEIKVHPNKFLLSKRKSLRMRKVAEPVHESTSKPVENETEATLGPNDDEKTRKNLAHIVTTTSKPEESTIPDDSTSTLNPEYSAKLEQILREIEAQERLISESQTTVQPRKTSSTFKPTEEVTEASTIPTTRRRVLEREATTVRPVEEVPTSTSNPDGSRKEEIGVSDKNVTQLHTTTLEPVTQPTSENPSDKNETNLIDVTTQSPEVTEPATSTVNPKEVVIAPKPRTIRAHHLTVLEQRLEKAIAKLEQTSKSLSRTLGKLQTRSKSPKFVSSKDFEKLLSRADRFVKVYPAWVLRDPKGETKMFVEEKLGMSVKDFQNETDSEHF